ncbi:prephenate dehydrogenase [uncultured Georgenia sp.]|uniref:prephenate dehydrogenase n=1 Tax=uncultured Georgenia sp. TaxID=378209 RepID=UPI002639387D|nr:prephenate dehydrogenase [uncultured Georgenia sp.]HLV03024.1 prephenate dehydrogenase [Actinomycetaceae bacterium]
MSRQAAPLTTGPVKVVGTGLLGTSTALGLRRLGVTVILADTSPSALALARDMGAGDPEGSGGPEPALVVVATPPDVAGDVVLEMLYRHPDAVVTDVASVKAVIAQEVAAGAEETQRARYVGSHPMAGRERSGAAAADADLFAGRPWVVAATDDTPASAATAVRNLALDLGALPVTLPPTEHDEAVALVSHLPQLAASLVAARLVDAPEAALSLAGQGLRDVTRIAASDPRLWAAILVGNAAPVADGLRRLRDDLDAVIAGLDRAATEGPLAPGAVGALTHVIAAGNSGVARIPGKHGGAPRRYATVQVLVPDQPGELGRLFGEVGELGVNIEDLQLEHSAGAPVGIAHLSVVPAAAAELEEGLTDRGWSVVAE